MSIVIFDLKNTLVSNEGELSNQAKRLIQEVSESSSKLWLYSIAEAWTYSVLARYKPLFALFDGVLLVKNKCVNDLAFAQEVGRQVWVIGDDCQRELAFATEIGFTPIEISSSESIYDSTTEMREQL